MTDPSALVPVSAGEDAIEAAAEAAVTAAFLALGTSLERLGLALLLAALGLWLAMRPAVSSPLLAASMLPFAAQAWYGLRVRFDREIFAIWAARWQAGSASSSVRDDMRAFDAALGRARPDGSLAMGLAHRAAGARRLLRRQALALSVQLMLVAAALLAAPELKS